MSSDAPHFSSRDLVFALCIVVCWGLNFVVIKVALRDFTPFQLGAARYVLAALPLVLFIKPPQVPAQWLLIYGLTLGVGQFGFLFVALRVGMSASLASVLIQTQVFFTALLGLVWLREPLKSAQWLGMALAAGGLIFFALHFVASQTEPLQVITGLGLFLTLCAAALWGASNLMARHIQALSVAQHGHGYDPMAFVAWTALAPILPFILMSVLFDAPETRIRWLHASWASWASVAYLGWLATVMAYGMWTSLLKRHAVGRVAPLSLGVPVVGVAAGMLLLSESISTWQWAGIACIVGALIVNLTAERFMASFKRVST
jgi:O-acetylserine/cysteine efflux transporter